MFVGTKDLRDKGKRILYLRSHCEQLIDEMRSLSEYVAQFPNLAMVTKLDLVKVRDEYQLEWRRAGSSKRYSFAQVDANAFDWVGNSMAVELREVNALVVMMNRDLKLSLSLLRVFEAYEGGCSAGDIAGLTKRV